MKGFLFCMTLMLPMIQPHAAVIDGITLGDRRVIKGVTVHNAKVGDTRIFHAQLEKEIKAPIAQVLKNILEFDERCNNEYKDKRKFGDKSKNCKHFNKNLVESQIIRNIKPGFKKELHESDRFLVRRNIYNRQFFSYYDVVVVRKWRNKKEQKVAHVRYGLLSDQEAAKYLDGPGPMNSAFHHIAGTYTIVEIDASTTHMSMTYVSKTNHWMLNKWISVGIIYKNMAKGNRSTMELIERASISL